MEKQNQDNSETPEGVDFTDKVMEIVSSDFEPIKFIDANASDFYSTEQIGKILDSRLGEMIPRISISNALDKLAYSSKKIGDKYYWMMRAG